MDLVSAAEPPAEARRARPAAWVAAHQERLAAALVGLLLLVMVGSGITAGFLLRHSANGQRQTLRLQALDSAALRGDRSAMTAALAGVEKHDAAAAERLIPASRAGTQRLQ